MTDKELFALRDSWYEEAKNQTEATLPAFIAKLTTYDHDYNTICYASAAAALAGAWTMNASPNGGITGFQAGAIMWEFITKWMSKEGEPLRLTNFKDMLFPQYESKFHSITASTWQYLQSEAKKLLLEGGGAEHVREHWDSIAAGIIPFGFTIED